MINFPRRFGVHSNLKQGIKIWGPIYAIDALILLATLLIMTMGGNTFFSNTPSNIPQIVYMVSVGLLGFYMVLRPRTNPGKRNLNLLILTFTPSIRFFQSTFSHNHAEMHTLADYTKGANHRLIVTRQDIKGDKFE